MDLKSTITGWQPQDYVKNGDKAYHVHFNGVNYYKTVYNVKTIEEAYNKEAFVYQNEHMPQIKPFPTHSTSYEDEYYFYFGKDGVFINAGEMEILFTINNEGYVESLSHYPGI